MKTMYTKYGKFDLSTRKSLLLSEKNKMIWKLGYYKVNNFA